MKPKSRNLRQLCLLFATFSTAPLHATVTVVGVDATTGPNWRTAAALAPDGQYGTLGYVVFGLNETVVAYRTNWNIGIEEARNAYDLPAGVTVSTSDSAIGMWPGNGNFGMMEDPANANALTPTPVLANSAGPKRFTITRANPVGYRLTLLTASGDGAGATYSPSVNDGSGTRSTTHTHTANGLAYHVFQVTPGTSNIVIDITSTPNWSLTGIAFDEFVIEPEGPPLVWLGATGAWDTATAGNWKLAADNSPAVFSNSPAHPVRFDDTATTTTLDIAANVTPLSMEFANSTKNYTLQGSGAIGGNASLTKSGTGTLTIANSNTFGGETEITAGTLILADVGRLGGGTYALPIMNDGTIIHSSSANQVFSGVISGTGSITASGPGTLTLGGINGFSGNVRVTGGTLVATLPTATSATGSFGNLQVPGKTITVESGGTLRHGNNNLYFNNAAGLAAAEARLIIAGGTLDTGTSFSNVKSLELHSGALITGTNGVSNQQRSLGLVGTVTVKGGSGAMTTIESPGAAGGIHLGNSALAVSSVTFDVDAASGGLRIVGPLVNQANSMAAGSLVKTGNGTLTLAGTNIYTGTTTVSEGTLEITGSLEASFGAVTIGNTASLTGDGTITRPVTIAGGGTLDPAGDEVGTLSIANLSLGAGSTTVVQVEKTGGLIDSDLIETTSITYGGTLEINASGQAFAVGDSIKLFDAVANYSSAFSDFVRPPLPAGLHWDFSYLATDGTARIVDTAPAPFINPGSGGYVGAQSVTIASGPGTTIHYTTDGSDPLTSPTKVTVASPATGVMIPTDSESTTLTAYASLPGFADSRVVSATYSTITTPSWNVDEDGPWSLATNWKNHVIPDGVGVTADFNAFPQTANANVTIDIPRTVGGLVFGNSNGFDWTLSAAPGANLRLATANGSPGITVINGTANVATPLIGSQGFTKSGAGVLRLSSNANSFTGDILLAEGTILAPAAVGGLNPATGSLGSPRVPRTITLAPGTTLGMGANDVFGNHSSAANVSINLGTGASLVNTGNFFNILGPLRLDGATVHTIGGANPSFPSFSFKGTVTAVTGATSTISGVGTNSEYHLGDAEVTETTFDVQGNGMLNITGVLQNGASGGIPTSLRKTGTGTLTLGGLNSYTGNTSVNEGTLILADTGGLRFNIGATSGAGNRLTGSGSGTVVIAGDFVINTAAAAALTVGTWQLVDVATLTGPYAPTFSVVDPTGTPWTDAGNDTWTRDNGAGILWTFNEMTGTLVLGDGGSGNFESWAAENGITGGPTGDSNSNGIPNLVEYALDLDLAGPGGSVGTFANGVLSFTKRPLAVTQGDVSYVIEVSTDLGKTDPWLAVTPTQNNSTTISYSLPTGGPMRFARLSVTLTP